MGALGWLILVLGLAAPAFAQPSPAERPTYRVGETWARSDGTFTLTRIERDRHVFAASDRREIHLTHDLFPILVRQAGTIRWELEPPPRLSWPLDAARPGVHFGTLRATDESGLTVRVTWHPERRRAIQVPAGTFEAVGLTVRTEAESFALAAVRRRGRPSEFTLWYAPAVGRLVKIEGGGVPELTFELVAIPPGVAAAPAPGASPRSESDPPARVPPRADPAKPSVTALRVDVRYPDDRARVAQAASVVAAVVSSPTGVSAVNVTLNGAEVHRQALPAPQPSVAVSVPVTLREGANAVVVTATAADGASRQELRTVFLEAPAAPGGAPPAAIPSAAERWAVVVGVGRYQSRDVPALRYAVADAQAMYETLTTVAGFKKEHVLLMTDATERKPTLRNLKWALGTFLARSAKREDTVVIYFAGHGAPEVDQRGLERDGLAKYLIPVDGDPDDLYSTALPMDELVTIFGRLEAERVVAFLDTCFSGAAGGRTFSSKRTRAGVVDDLFLERLTRSKGRAIVTASRPAEVSVELPELGHGIFTYYLVRALRGAGDLNRDGIVSLQELYEYVEQQVSQKARAVGGRQHPMLKGELEGVLPLSKSGRVLDSTR
jgi:hypothetical protein